MGGNLPAHNMETESMEDWTKQADIDADQRCPDKCMIPGCTRVATEAFTFYFFHVWLEDEHGNRVRRLHATPWWYVCQGCGESVGYDVFDKPGHEELLDGIREASYLGAWEQ